MIPVANEFADIAKALKSLEVERQGTTVSVNGAGKYVPVPDGQKSRVFARKLKSQWGKVFHVKNKSRSPVDWSDANIVGFWSHSIGHEVYYFSNETDASLFKLINS